MHDPPEKAGPANKAKKTSTEKSKPVLEDYLAKLPSRVGAADHVIRDFKSQISKLIEMRKEVFSLSTAIGKLMGHKTAGTVPASLRVKVSLQVKGPEAQDVKIAAEAITKKAEEDLLEVLIAARRRELDVAEKQVIDGLEKAAQDTTRAHEALVNVVAENRRMSFAALTGYSISQFYDRLKEYITDLNLWVDLDHVVKLDRQRILEAETKKRESAADMAVDDASAETNVKSLVDIAVAAKVQPLINQVKNLRAALPSLQKKGNGRGESSKPSTGGFGGSPKTASGTGRRGSRPGTPRSQGKGHGQAQKQGKSQNKKKKNDKSRSPSTGSSRGSRPGSGAYTPRSRPSGRGSGSSARTKFKGE